MKTLLKFIAIHTLFWIAAESLYTRGKIHFVKKNYGKKHHKSNLGNLVTVLDQIYRKSYFL